MPKLLMHAIMVWNLTVILTWLVGPFVVAGGIAWTTGWFYTIAIIFGLVCHRMFVSRHNPELFRARKELGLGTKRWDIVWNLLFWPLMAAVPIVAGVGARRGWQLMPVWAWFIGLLLYATAMTASAWAMSVNRHFEGTVRIQRDRDHRVVDAGPYRHVRHPGYLGLILWVLASPFLLRSFAAFVPAGVVVGWLVLRTVLEDATLRAELPGYLEYSARVPYRLFPRWW